MAFVEKREFRRTSDSGFKSSPPHNRASDKSRCSSSWPRRFWDLGILLVVFFPLGMGGIRFASVHQTDILAWARGEFAANGWLYLYAACLSGLMVALLSLCAASWAKSERGRADVIVKDFERLQRQVTLDVLTGTLSRRTLEERMENEFYRARRYHRPIAAIFVDVDNFKGFNDFFGHALGDRVLRRVASAIRTSIRDSDTVGRYGGDEFLILLPETRTEEAVQTAERIRKSVGNIPIHSPSGSSLTITVSAGVLGGLPKGVEWESFLDSVDKALRRAKEAGKNCVTICEPELTPV